MKQYTRKCPKCEKELKYKTYRNWWKSNKDNALCISCCQKGKTPHNKINTENLERVCRQCSEVIVYENRTSFLRAKRKDNLCRSCVVKNYNKERTWSEKSIAKIRHTKAKNRIENKTQRCFGNINPKGCEYMESLNKSMGWNLLHARNGGEQLICGYWLDGYDKDENIVVEYDEPYHYPYGKLRQRDVVRQSRIIEFLSCRFFRYNEKTDTLYEITKTS